MTDGKFCAKCLSHHQEILEKTRLLGTGKYSKLGRTLYSYGCTSFPAKEFFKTMKSGSHFAGIEETSYVEF